MLLLTGATGTIGLPLLRRLLAAGMPVRCLVRNPRRLGAERVRVQIALGDLADHRSLRNALRGVDTVVHLASVIRDQPAGTIEELSGVATWRLLRAAERAGVERFVFFSALGATTRSDVRLMRAKAVAEQAVLGSSVPWTVFAPSWVYAPGDPFLTLLEDMSLLPVMPIPGRGEAAFQPISADDVAECVIAALGSEDAAGARYELAGPETLSYREIVEVALQSFERPRPILPVPMSVVRTTLKLTELLMGPDAFATMDEVELLEVPAVSAGGAVDVERLGVRPRAMREVLLGGPGPGGGQT